FVARDRGQWDRAESYFNEAERLDPRNVSLLTRHAQFYIAMRRFPEAVRKLDLILEIAPNDTDALVERRRLPQRKAICRQPPRFSLKSSRLPATRLRGRH